MSIRKRTNFINVEKSMLDLLKFYNSVFATVVPIAPLLFKFLDKTQIFNVLAALAFIVFPPDLYILAMGNWLIKKKIE